jgi:predicted small metal-binding protein
MRVIDCDCGTTLQAADDGELSRVMRQHMDEVHPDRQLADEQLEALVSDQAYTATDA